MTALTAHRFEPGNHLSPRWFGCLPGARPWFFFGRFKLATVGGTGRNCVQRRGGVFRASCPIPNHPIMPPALHATTFGASMASGGLKHSRFGAAIYPNECPFAGGSRFHDTNSISTPFAFLDPLRYNTEYKILRIITNAGNPTPEDKARGHQGMRNLQLMA